MENLDDATRQAGEQDPVIAQALKEIAPQPEVKQEEQPETKIDEKETQQTIEPEAEPVKETPPVEVPKTIERTVPLAAKIRLEKELKAKLAEKDQEIARLKEEKSAPVSEPTTPAEWEDNFFRHAQKMGWDQATYEAEREKALIIQAPILSRLEKIKQYEAEIEEKKQEKEIDDYYTNLVDELDETIKAEHKGITDIEVRDIKNKIKELAKKEGITNVSLIYNGTSDFRPAKRSKSAEPSRTSGIQTQKVIDFDNLSIDDFAKLPDEEKLKYSRWLEEKEKSIK